MSRCFTRIRLSLHAAAAAPHASNNRSSVHALCACSRRTKTSQPHTPTHAFSSVNGSAACAAGTCAWLTNNNHALAKRCSQSSSSGQRVSEVRDALTVSKTVCAGSTTTHCARRQRLHAPPDANHRTALCHHGAKTRAKAGAHTSTWLAKINPGQALALTLNNTRRLSRNQTQSMARAVCGVRGRAHACHDTRTTHNCRARPPGNGHNKLGACPHRPTASTTTKPSSRRRTQRQHCVLASDRPDNHWTQLVSAHAHASGATASLHTPHDGITMARPARCRHAHTTPMPPAHRYASG
jgi:hypothetical protein